MATDQGVEHGGGGAAPEPFDLFLASLGTCAGLYALRFCQLPEGFPEKYNEALIRSVDQCAVKRHIVAPPRFEAAEV